MLGRGRDAGEEILRVRRRGWGPRVLAASHLGFWRFLGEARDECGGRDKNGLVVGLGGREEERGERD